MMFSAWNTVIASSRFRYAIGKFIHAFIYRIYGVYSSPACWYAGLLYLWIARGTATELPHGRKEKT